MEVPHTTDWARMELALGYELGTRQGDAVTLNEPQRFTALSVLDSLQRALGIDRAAAETAGVDFDRKNWFPTDEAAAEIRETHRPYLRFLRGLAGLEELCLDILDSKREFDPPLRQSQIDALVSGTTHLMGVNPFGEGQGAFNEIAGGGGKSLIIAMFAQAFKIYEDPEDPNRVLVIVSDSEVQAELAGLDGTSGLGKYAPNLDVEVVTSSTKQVGKDVQVVTKDMARRLIERDPTFANRFDLIISDESQALLGPKTSAAIQSVHKPIIGFTGSAKSSYRQVSDLLPTRLTEYRSRELTEAGELAPIQHWIVKTGEVIETDSRSAEYSAEELHRIASLPRRRQIAADFGLTFLKNNLNGAFSCSTVAEAREFAAALDGLIVTTTDGRERPIRVVPILGGMNDNHETIQRLNDDEIQAITFVNIYGGWNAPRLKFMVNLRPTKSPIVAAQRRARGQRTYCDVEGNEFTCQIVDLVDTMLVRDLYKLGLDGYGLEKFIPPDRQILAPQLMDETVYRPGLVIASPQSEGKRHDFSVAMFPKHLHWALTMANGVPLHRIHLLGAGSYRERPPEESITMGEAARGLGITVSRLQVVLATISPSGIVPRFIDETSMTKVEERLFELDEPLDMAG